MSKNSSSSMDGLKAAFPVIIMILAFIAAQLIFRYVLGNPHNFMGNNPANHPLQGNFMGVIYKGGFIVPILITMFLIVIIFSIERLISISRAKGKTRLNVFLFNIKGMLESNQIDSALEACDKQKGSLANVVKAGLIRYKEMKKDTVLVKDQKIIAIQKEIEEATALELPMLSKNLMVLSTIAPLGTLVALVGTVLGMIRAFSALATSGSPDSVALSTGISEALVNTAFGISTSAVAILFYNVFSSQIDDITFKIDEANFSLVQTFASQEK